MDLSDRNSKVSVNRWKRTHDEERNKFCNCELSEIKLAAIIGFLQGDGTVGRFYSHDNYYRYKIAFYPDDHIMQNTFLNYFIQLFSKKMNVKNLEYFSKLTLTSKTVGMYLLEIADFGIQSWRLPSSFTLSQKIVWLKALMSAEGYVGNQLIRIQTVNEQGMQDVASILVELGIKHKSYIYKPQKLNHSTVFIIVIGQLKEIQKFEKIIGFWHSKKSSVLKKQLALKKKG